MIATGHPHDEVRALVAFRVYPSTLKKSYIQTVTLRRLSSGLMLYRIARNSHSPFLWRSGDPPFIFPSGDTYELVIVDQHSGEARLLFSDGVVDHVSWRRGRAKVVEVPNGVFWDVWDDESEGIRVR